MAEPIMFPSLSEDGWVTSSQKIADIMLAHFFVSNYSQTTLYPGLVSSFPYILALNHGNIQACCSETQRALTAYYGRYFDQVEVEVSEIPNETAPAKAIISIYVSFIDSEGKKISVGQAIKIVDSVFEKVAAIINS